VAERRQTGPAAGGEGEPHFTFSPTLAETLRENLAAFPVREAADDALRPAAVSVVVTGGGPNGEACVLLTLRPDRLKRHGGQYALPGGRLDAGETALQAALRELHEELGLGLDASAVLGRLDDFPTRSGFRIAPYVLWGGEAPTLAPDPEEVAELFHITLDELCSPDIPYLDHGQGGAHPVLSAPLPTLGHHVYAPTAALLYQFREVALLGRHTRVAHYDQPQFAWK
jgi:8-oxo-dGTP pyrophosphatase MutT (NUDIX family)